MKRIAVVMSLGALLMVSCTNWCGSSAYTQTPAPKERTYAVETRGSAITIPELRDHITYLASDELEGRKPGTEGARKAAEYIRQEFRSDGLTLMGDDGYQYFDVTTSVSMGDGNKLVVNGAEADLDSEWIPLAFSSDADLTAPVVFAGYGFVIDEDSLKWDSYDGIDVTDKWVMVLRGDPEPDQPHSEFMMHASLRNKVLKAEDHGAAGVIFVAGDEFDPDDELVPLYYDQSQSRAQIPAININREFANALLEGSGHTIADLEKGLMESRTPMSFATDKTVSATVALVQNDVTTQNVVAYLEGSDPELKNDVIVIGAHYDHLGYGGPHSGSRRPDEHAIHNGADDNASGVSGLLEIADYLAARRDELHRSVIFIAFSAEEIGVLGSKYFVRNTPIDRDQVKYMINLDMIGRWKEDGLHIGGTGTAVGIESMLERMANQRHITLEMSKEGYGPSDHASFYVEDIPVLFFFTGAHEDYHTPQDDVDKINFAGTQAIARFAADVAKELINRKTTMAFQEAGPKEAQSSRTRLRVTLGIMPDYGDSGGEGLRVDAVLEDRPAKRAGMKKGDVIVALEGKKVTNIYDYMYRLAELRPGQRATVDVMRDGELKVLIVDL